MADLADVSQERAEREAPYILAANRRPVGPLARGTCYYCDEPVAAGMRWCVGVECRDAWQKEQERRV